jgi:hypothetical protein
MGLPQKKYTEEQLDVAEELYDDFEVYAFEALKIKPKDKNAPGIKKGVVPLVFNTAQKYLQWRINDQLRRIGKVRMFVLKGRQQGCSTFIEGLFFWITSLNYSIKTFIQTHSKKATKNLYAMAKRFLKNLPNDVKPRVDVSNTNEMTFDELDSGYMVATAGQAESGRSDTIDLLHGSEVAFWKSTLDHTAGLIQAVPDAKGSYIVLESTANGMGGYFHKGYTKAEAGTNGDYEAVFIPWYWQEEYRKPVKPGFKRTPYEEEYVRLYDTYPEFDDKGGCNIIKKKIDDEQLQWRRDKIAELEDSVDKFNQEYPATPQMAFQYSAVVSHIPAKAVEAAMQRAPYSAIGKIYAGFDVAVKAGRDSEGDRNAFIYRQRANVFGLDYPVLDGYRAKLGYLKKKLDCKVIPIHTLFIGFGGGGYDLYIDLCEDGYSDRVCLVNEGSSPEDGNKYISLKAEMTDRIKIALLDDTMPLSIKVDPKYKSAFMTDLIAESSYEDHLERLHIEKKEKVKARLGISPDGKDAVEFTFARGENEENLENTDNVVIESEPLYFEKKRGYYD